eukprot:CAMPEP_0185183916 /NCGR_PEP_ID=MMETSP1140-20130426/2261_1 /TAXON_ID=298111 /ORGANISM="Pavlova sp., Strain CCMP459" /LENGTH=90 /DNA_ID=CAMNT_0027749951 /DNA_START=138 /DNA_END=407 /DNA_ORIENTATION=-
MTLLTHRSGATSFHLLTQRVTHARRTIEGMFDFGVLHATQHLHDGRALDAHAKELDEEVKRSHVNVQARKLCEVVEVFGPSLSPLGRHLD